jgi:hypothetical protein
MHVRRPVEAPDDCHFFFFTFHPPPVENDDRSEPMKVDSVALPTVPITQTTELPIIKADDIKTILYLGIRGEIKLDTGRKHTVDTYA